MPVLTPGDLPTLLDNVPRRHDGAGLQTGDASLNIDAPVVVSSGAGSWPTAVWTWRMRLAAQQSGGSSSIWAVAVVVRSILGHFSPSAGHGNVAPAQHAVPLMLCFTNGL